MDGTGQKHTDWAAHINSQAEADVWAKNENTKLGKDGNGHDQITDVKDIGKTGVVEKGWTDQNGKEQPYTLNVDGSRTAADGTTSGKPTTTKEDAANAEPAQSVASNNSSVNKEDAESATPPILAANKALDKGFTFNDAVSKLSKLPVSRAIESAGNIVTGVGVAGNVYEAGKNFHEGQTMNGVYNTFKAVATIAVAVAFPEGLLLWGVELMVSDMIIDAIKK